VAFAVKATRSETMIKRTLHQGDRLMKRVLLFLAVLTLLAYFPTVSFADTIIVGPETDTGFEGPLPDATLASGATIRVGSDGEVAFDPYDAGYDTSDGIVLDRSFREDPRFPNSFSPPGTGSPGLWQQITQGANGQDPGNAFTWVLPSVMPGFGSENEPSGEPVGHWDAPGTTWARPHTYTINSADGALSDVIILSNTGPGGDAAVTFFSDPSLPVPEPASLTLLALGVAGLAATRLRKKSA
jgi:hypothetical protein